MGWWEYAPYVPVAQQRAKAARAAQKLEHRFLSCFLAHSLQAAAPRRG